MGFLFYICNMRVYYLLDLELGWDNLVCLATSRIKCIEAYTDGDVMPKTEEEVDKFLSEWRNLYMGYKFLND